MSSVGSSGGVALSPMVEGAEAPIIQALLCATDYGILMTDHAGQDVLCNPRFGELFDVDPDKVVHSTRDEVRRMALARVKNPEAFSALIERIYADPALEHEDEIELSTDEPRILRRYTAPVFDARGRNIGRLWTFQDVTRTRRLEAEVREYANRTADDLRDTALALDAMTAISAGVAASEDQAALSAAIAHAASGLAGNQSAAFLVTDANRFHGIGVRETGKDLEIDLKRSDAESAYLDADELRVIDSGTGVLSEALGTGRVTVLPLRGPDGVKTGILALGGAVDRPAYDGLRLAHLGAVADQAALALEAMRLRSRLQIAYDDLQLAQEGLVESAKLSAVGTLAAGIAHDIRNILTPLQLEISSTIAGSAQEAVRAQIGRLSALTHRLLALSRPAKIHLQPTSISEVLESVLVLLRPQVEIDGIRVDLQIPADLPPTLADSGRLEHLFINLGLNALAVMAPSGGTLTLAAISNEATITIEVRDTGPGIPPENLDRMFEPFFTTRANGTGLGLFSARRIAEEMGGNITAMNADSGGAVFRVALQAYRSPEE